MHSERGLHATVDAAVRPAAGPPRLRDRGRADHPPGGRPPVGPTGRPEVLLVKRTTPRAWELPGGYLNRGRRPREGDGPRGARGDRADRAPATAWWAGTSAPGSGPTARRSTPAPPVGPARCARAARRWRSASSPSQHLPLGPLPLVPGDHQGRRRRALPRRTGGSSTSGLGTVVTSARRSTWAR